MKIKLLYSPRFSMTTFDATPTQEMFYIPPLGISFLTAVLRKNGIKAEQDDLNVKAVNSKEINLELFNDEKKVKKLADKKEEESLEKEGEKILKLTEIKGFDIVGLSLFDADNPSVVGVALALAKLIKEKYGSVIIAGGRVIPSDVRDTLLLSKLIDYFVPSEGILKISPENVLLEFCKMFEKGKEDKTPGIKFLKCGNIVENPVIKGNPRKLIMPCFDGLPLDLYTYRMSVNLEGQEYSSRILVLPYMFVDGCPYNCAFCGGADKPFWMGKNKDEVIEDLKYLSKKYKTKYFFLSINQINPTYEYANEICDAIIKEDLGIKWSSAANFFGMDGNLLKKMKESGACRLNFGFESASPRVMKYIRKNLNLKHVEKVLRLAHKLGIWVELNTISGFPYERMKDCIMTIDFLKRNRRYVKALYPHRFFIAGYIKKEPKKFGIHLRKNNLSISSNLRQEFGYDEIDGLRWEERKKLTNNIYGKMKRFLLDNDINDHSEVHEIFFLSSLEEWKKIMDKKWRVERTDKENLFTFQSTES